MSESVAPEPSRKKRVLVIEDDPSIGLGLRINLENEGYDVTLADDGDRGFELASSGDADIILLDLMLPKRNGFEILDGLRKRGIATPVILLSARTADLDKVTGLDLGAEDYVCKPFSLAELLARIRAALIDAVVNLISNAHKYGGNDPRVELDLTVGARFATVAVTDHGDGIPRHEQRRIFEKFYRIDDRLSRMKEGSGLGLAIVDHVVKAHGGEISVDSAPSRGSTLRIMLPLASRSSLLPKAHVTEAP